jgi:glycosyltransferase involved in cell wall biosynthesis
VPPGHASDLASAIVQLLRSSTLRASMGEAGLKHVATHFGVGRMLQDTLNAYRTAVEMNASTASLNF